MVNVIKRTCQWKNKKVLIIGAARQGAALARYLGKKGAQITITDLRTTEQLGSELASFQGYDIQWVLGSHPLNLIEDKDCVFVSGGVPLTNPLIVEARRNGIQVSNDSQLFFDEAPCKIIGITGSAGKTTTTTLVGRIGTSEVAKNEKAYKVWVGGNIGNPLISYIEEMREEDIAVCELSSFQLELMVSSPQIAAILNITPNHLDRHGTMEAYIAAKANILAFQSKEDMAVLNREDVESWNLSHTVKGRLFSFGKDKLPVGYEGTFLEDDNIMLSFQGKKIKVLNKKEVTLRGEHNLMNVLAACAIAATVGFSVEATAAGVRGFLGVAHRLELVRQLNGVQWINDSIATAPERTLAAIRSFNEPLILLLGGRDKKLPWQDLAKVIHERVKHVVVFGEAGEMIARVIEEQAKGNMESGALKSIQRCKSMQQAIEAAASIAQSGDVVLFSPGGTSFDEFKDFEERGERFREWVTKLNP